MKNAESRRVACYLSGRYFSVITAAGVRSNIFDTTLLLASRLARCLAKSLSRAGPGGPGSFRTRPPRHGQWPGRRLLPGP